jgi:predicted alpha/beta-fold hydrolase
MAAYLVLFLLLGFYTALHYLYLHDNVVLHYISTQVNEKIIKMCPSISPGAKYRYPMFFGWSGLIHSLYSIFKSVPPLSYKRTTIKDPYVTEPITLDWLDTAPTVNATTPTIVILPGITGSVDAPYIRSLAKHLQHDYRVVVYSRPGCGTTNKVAIQTPHFFYNCHPLTIKALLEAVDDQNQHKSPIYVIGFSMGGQNIVRAKGEHPLPMVKGIITINQPYNTEKMVAKIIKEQRLYDKALTSFIRNVFTENTHIYKDILTAEQISAVAKVDSLRDLDEVWTKPVHGFKDIEKDYYAHRTITHDHLMAIDVPTIMLQALDDAVLAPATLAKYVFDIASEKNSNIIVVRTDHGSHCSYEQMGPWLFIPSSTPWMDQVCLEVLHAIITVNNSRKDK